MKRLFDLSVTLLGAVALAPLMILIVVVVYLNSGGPVFFMQVRPGKSGKPFKVFKFRTMTDARDAKGALLPDADRLTWLGKFLRSTSLDELPELINVLKGEMSLVGPRPLLMHYLDRYTAEQARRHEVKPGITGWSQVNGRNALSWEEKFRLDVWYVDHWSLWLDIKIIFMTIAKVLCCEGIHAQGEATVSEFTPLLHKSEGSRAKAHKDF